MAAHEINDYFSMLKAGKALSSNEKGLPKIKVAILANYSTQQFEFVVKSALVEAGYFPEIFAAEYDTAALEVYNSESALFAFKPDFAFLGLAVQYYRTRFLACQDPQERERLPKTYGDEITGLVKTLKEHGIQAIISNLALPLERMFGNFGLMTNQSLYGSVLNFNLELRKISEQKLCSILDIMYLSSVVGAKTFLDEKLWVSSKYLCANKYLPEIARNLSRIIAVQKGQVKKCLVLDLDNTLWGGVIGDDGIDGIKLGHGDAYSEAFQLFQSYLLGLKHRGFILAVCSKNNEDTARTVFQKHEEMVLREEDIAVFVANWNDKGANIEFIARTLNIGLDSVIFIDDSPFERNLVRSVCPTVAVPEMPEDISDYISAIEESGLLEATGYSKEDFSRNQMYREEASRATEQIRYSNLDDYLKSLEIRVQAGPFMSADIPRIAQLLQRSNQFNLRTQRFDESACTQFAEKTDRYFTMAVKLRDRFGDYGLISVVCGERQESVLYITELVMSCRVLKRGVEEFLINRLVEYCREHQFQGIQGEYVKTAKNAMVKDFYRKFGFSQLDGNDERQSWFLEVKEFSPLKTFVLTE